MFIDQSRVRICQKMKADFLLRTQICVQRNWSHFEFGAAFTILLETVNNFVDRHNPMA